MLRPDDIVNYPLKQAVRGYSVAQVDELLDQVADQLERTSTELDQTRRRLEQCEQRLTAASETETTLKRTLVTAQRAAEQSMDEATTRAAELLEDARREAAAISEQARLDGDQLRVDALQAARAEEAEIRRRRQALEQQVEGLRVFEREYRARLRGFLEEQLRSIDDLQARPAKPAPLTGEDGGVGAAPAMGEDVELAPNPIAEQPVQDPAPTTGNDALQVRVHEPNEGRPEG